MIDKRYFVADRSIYYGDLLLSLAVLITAYTFLTVTDGTRFVVLYLICIAALYRVAVFAHEICHRERDERMKAFAVFWNLTGGALTLEHGMVLHVEQSDARDRVLDSFTIEAPLVAILQPLGLRFHTAHHMYPRCALSQAGGTAQGA